MTESQWFSCNDPDAMLDALRGRLRPPAWRRLWWDTGEERRQRLFACACCRRIWLLLCDERSRQAVEVAERFADRLAGQQELNRARIKAHAAVVEADVVGGATAWAAGAALAAAGAEVWAVWGTAWAATAARGRAMGGAAGERRAQCDLLRDIFGNPFRPVSVTLPRVHRRRRVLALARAIYEGRRFRELPVLADLLREAGCDSEDVLSHCLSPREHVRGCWVLDALLGKK